MSKKIVWLVTLILLAAGTFANAQQGTKIPRIGYLANFSPIEKIKAALRGIKVVSSIGYAKGEERPYENRVYNRTNGISATGAAASDREI